MKKLFTNSAMALVLFSFFAASCEKENPAPPAPAIEVKTTWTPKGAAKPTVTTGDIKNGDVGVAYKIEPKLVNCKCVGTWDLTMEAPKNAQYVAIISGKTGVVDFRPLTPGTYKLTLTCKCADGSKITITITITVS